MNGKFFTWTKVVSGALVLYWLALFISTHVPNHSSGGGGNTDKYAHFIAYAGLGFLLSWTLYLRIGRMGAAVFAALTIAALYGALDELLQIPLKTRQGDPWDWGADICGATIGLAAFALLQKTLLQKIGTRLPNTAAEAALGSQSENQG